MISMELLRMNEEVEKLMQLGYTRDGAISLIQVTAINKLASVVSSGYDGKPYLRIHGSVAEYEQ